MRRALAVLFLAPLLAAQTPLAPQAHHGVRLPDAFFAGNRARLLAKAKAMGPGTLVVAKSMPTQPSSGGEDRPYRQDSDFYYLTGVEEEHAVALLDVEAGTVGARPALPGRDDVHGPAIGSGDQLVVGQGQQLIEDVDGDQRPQSAERVDLPGRGGERGQPRGGELVGLGVHIAVGVFDVVHVFSEQIGERRPVPRARTDLDDLGVVVERGHQLVPGESWHVQTSKMTRINFSFGTLPNI